MAAVMKLLERNSDGALLFSKSGLDDIKNQAETIRSGEELYDLLGCLIDFSAFLGEKKNAPTGASQLLDLVEALLPRMAERVSLGVGAPTRKLEEIERRLAAEKNAATAAADRLFPDRPKNKGVRLRKT